MNKKIYDKFIEAEKEWIDKIKEVFNTLFDEVKWSYDYKELAELSLVIQDRLDYYVEDDNMAYLYIELRWKVFCWANDNLGKDYDKFCQIADNYYFNNE
jgi:hypothetical protein